MFYIKELISEVDEIYDELSEKNKCHYRVISRPITITLHNAFHNYFFRLLYKLTLYLRNTLSNMSKVLLSDIPFTFSQEIKYLIQNCENTTYML